MESDSQGANVVKGSGMTDITWCVSKDCPEECEKHIRNCPQKEGMVSMADLSGVCRKYIFLALNEVEKEKPP